MTTKQWCQGIILIWTMALSTDGHVNATLPNLTIYIFKEFYAIHKSRSTDLGTRKLWHVWSGSHDIKFEISRSFANLDIFHLTTRRTIVKKQSRLFLRAHFWYVQRNPVCMYVQPWDCVTYKHSDKQTAVSVCLGYLRCSGAFKHASTYE